MTLVCLPFAGGTQTSFSFLQKYLPPEIKYLCLEYPGHGRRMNTAPLHDLDAIVSDALTQLLDRVEGDYLLFGHSMGACVAFLVAERIAQSFSLPPKHLFLSGHGAITRRQQTHRHLLPRNKFLALINDLQGTPAEVFSCPELVDLVEPILRVDFAALDTYSRTDFASLPYPVTILHGSDDPSVNRTDIYAWRDLCADDFSCREFSGGHFFIHDHAAALAALVTTAAFPSAQSHGE